jgi:hypothetical protein
MTDFLAVSTPWSPEHFDVNVVSTERDLVNVRFALMKLNGAQLKRTSQGDDADRAAFPQQRDTEYGSQSAEFLRLDIGRRSP